MKGTVKWFDSAKGYGFITTEAGSDIFVHYTGINKKILIFSIFHPKKAADSLCGFFYRPDLLRSASERYAARRLSPLFVRHMAHDML